MKSKFLILFTLLNVSQVKSQSLLIDSIIEFSSLQQTVSFLSHDSLEGRFTGSDGAELAAKFIAAKFDSLGLNYIQGNEGSFNTFYSVYGEKKIKISNVVACLQPILPNDTIIIFSAHYDHIGLGNGLQRDEVINHNDKIYNGANDNATGIAALLELAKYYSIKKNNRYLLIFVAFSGEELGMLGSNYLAKKVNPKLVKAVINLEMFGRPVNDKCFIVSSKGHKIPKLLNKQLKKETGKKNNFFENDPFPNEFLFQRSDHYPFSNKVKNVFTIMGSSPQDEYYHTVDDEYPTINFNFLLLATKNIALACNYFVE